MKIEAQADQLEISKTCFIASILQGIVTNQIAAVSMSLEFQYLQ